MWRKSCQDVRNEEQQFWMRWLERYKTMKCLWHEDYKHTSGYNGRYAAYEELAELARVYCPEADVPFVRQRINSFRTNYRREARRLAAAKANGCSYETQLFYFKILDSFLNDSAEEQYGVKEESQDCSYTIIHDSNSTSPTMQAADRRYSGKSQKSKKENYVPPSKIAKAGTNESMSLIEDINPLDCNDNTMRSKPKNALKQRDSEEVNDEYEILGKRIAAHFRNMTFNQRLLAEKIITDVCICGRMDKLTMESTVFIETAGTQKTRESQAGLDYEEAEYIYET